MADFLSLSDYFLSRGFEKVSRGNWAGFRKTVNDVSLYFLEPKTGGNKLVKFEGSTVKHSKTFSGLKQRPKTHIMQLIQQAEAACITKAHIEAFTPRLTGILPMVEE